MSAETPAIVHEFKIGSRTVTMSLQTPQRGKVTNLVIEWAPEVPRRLSRRELRAYRAGRAVLLRRALHLMGGGTAAVIEL